MPAIPAVLTPGVSLEEGFGGGGGSELVVVDDVDEVEGAAVSSAEVVVLVAVPFGKAIWLTSIRLKPGLENSVGAVGS